ncbi:MAG TPA: DUF2867 domain-containing protein [Thermoanaerobaculia bacterium]|jgi:hypothetical protein
MAGEPSTLRERRERLVRARAADLYAEFSALGGARGWLAYDLAWRLRGGIDRLLGGPGMRRDRRANGALRVGDVVDFWRVEAVEPERRLRLRAEMRVPGRAWLEFAATDLGARDGNPTARLVQTAEFTPHGLAGRLYWFSLLPIHARIFDRLARRVGELAEARARAAAAG